MKNQKVLSRIKQIRFGAWPLTYKLAFIFLLTALAPMAILSYLSLTNGLNQVEKDQKEHLVLNSHNLSIQISNLLDQHKKFTVSLAKDPDVINYLNDQSNETFKELVDNDLSMLSRSLPRIAYVSLIDPNGVFTASSSPELIGFSSDFREYFRKAIQGQNYISSLILGTTTNENGVFFSAPVLNKKNHIIGAVVIKLKAEAIDEIFIKGGFHEYVMKPFLVDENEIIIYHPDQKYRYYPVRSLHSLQLGSEKNDFSHLDLSFKQPENIEFKINNTLFIAGVAPVSLKNWHVYVAKPYQEFATPIQKLFYKNLLFLLFFSIGSLILAWLLSRTFIRPINVLIEQAKKIKTGHYQNTEKNTDLLMVAQRSDELGNFAKVFDDMITEVYGREFALDQLVQQRTHELSEKNRLLAASYVRIDQELRLAHDMQQAILPQVFPQQAHFQIYANMRPAREMGGDFYDCFLLDDGRYAVLVADVAGKGIGSAFFMGVSSTIIKQAASTYHAPHQVLAFANQLLCERNPSELFVTTFYGVFDPKTAVFTYACAGHPAALLRQVDGSVKALPVNHDLPLGAWENVVYRSFSMRLAPSDMLLIYSDGVTEALSETNEEFGESRLITWLSQQGKQRHTLDLFATLKQSIKHFVGSAEPHDDMTVLLLRMQSQRKLTHTKTWKIRPELSEIEKLANQIEDFLQPLQLQVPSLAFEINLCIDELINNTIKHGSVPSNSYIEIELGFNQDTVFCQLQDKGIEFNPFTYAFSPDLDTDLTPRVVGGLGVHLIKRLVDEYSYTRAKKHNIVNLYKHLPLSKDTHEHPIT